MFFVEFAYFYHTIGTEVTIVEFLEQGLVPREDPDVSKELGKIYKKAGIKVPKPPPRKGFRVSWRNTTHGHNFKEDLICAHCGLPHPGTLTWSESVLPNCEGR